MELAELQTSDAGRYDVVVSNPSGSVTSDSAWLFVSGLETSLPSVAIVSPKSNERITNELNITISGTAKDTGLGVAQVFCRVNNSDWELADATTAWTYSTSVNPGLNNVQVKAKDFAGNESSVVSRNFFAVIFSDLTLTITGSGSAIGTASAFGTPADEATLEVGRSYTITAIPAVNNLFSNWTGSASSDLAKLTFTMESNMVLNANFVTNSFIAASGIYNGLFSEGTGVEFKSAGFVTLKVNAKQAISGKLLVDGNAISFSGKMTVDGTVIVTTKTRTKKTDKPELTVSLALDFANSTDTLTGTIVQPGLGGWTSDLLAHRVVWIKDGEPQATDFINSYTMLVPGSTNASEPAGSGYGAMKVDTLGKTRVSGHMADGQVLRQATVVSKQGDWAMFSPLYRIKRTNDALKAIVETKGFVMGWLQLTNNNGVGNLAPVGEVHWIKKEWTNSTYTAGFTNATEVIGSRWLAPVPKSGDRALTMTNALLSFSDGDLESPFEAIYSVTTNTTLAKIKLPTPEVYTNSLTASLVPKTGLIKGTFLHSANDTLTTKWFGAMLQDQNYGEGSFMGPTNSGKVAVAAVEPEE